MTQIEQNIRKMFPDEEETKIQLALAYKWPEGMQKELDEGIKGPFPKGTLDNAFYYCERLKALIAFGPKEQANV